MRFENTKQGDRMVAYDSRGNLTGTVKIDRVTKTQIITTSGTKYRRKNGDLVGAHSTWGCPHVREMSPELEATVNAEMRRRKLSDRLYRLGAQSNRMTDAQVDVYIAALNAAEKGN